MISKHHRFLIALILLVFFVGTLALSRHRPLDGDEGYYATAARLVGEGDTPYIDFFYPQMPLMPYVYAPLFKVAGSSLANMRLMSVALGVLSLFLWGLTLQRRWPDRPGLILAGLVLVAMNPYFLSWNVTVKTYAMTNLAVFATWWALDRGLTSRRWTWFLLAGTFAGLCVGARLLYLPWSGMLALTLGWLGLRGMKKGLSLGNPAAYLGGLLVGLVPSAVFLALDPDRFYFNNLRYHQLRFSSREAVDTADTPQILLALQEAGRALFLNPFMVLQLVLVGFGIDWARRHHDSPLRPLLILSGAGAMVHIVTCLFPDPVYEQYFTGPLTPLLAPLSVAGLARAMDLFRKPATVMALVLGLAAALSVVDLQARKTGMAWQEVWSFEHLGTVCEAIEGHTEPDDMVLAFWPGYVFETGREYLPGLENHFAIGVSEKLPLKKKIHYKIAGKELILDALANQYPKTIILGAWMNEINTTIEQKDLPILMDELVAKYKLEEVFGESKIMIRRARPDSSRTIPR